MLGSHLVLGLRHDGFLSRLPSLSAPFDREFVGLKSTLSSSTSVKWYFFLT